MFSFDVELNVSMSFLSRIVFFTSFPNISIIMNKINRLHQVLLSIVKMLDSAQGADRIGDIFCFVSRAKIKNGDFHYKFSIRYRNRYSNITFDMQLSVLKCSGLLSVFTKSCALTQFSLCLNVRRKSVQMCLKHCKYC